MSCVVRATAVVVPPLDSVLTSSKNKKIGKNQQILLIPIHYKCIHPKIVKLNSAHNFMDTAKVMVLIFTRKTLREGTVTKYVSLLGLIHCQEGESNRML